MGQGGARWGTVGQGGETINFHKYIDVSPNGSKWTPKNRVPSGILCGTTGGEAASLLVPRFFQHYARFDFVCQ